MRYLFAFLLTVFSHQVYCQQLSCRVASNPSIIEKTGERPPLDLTNFPDSAFLPGIIRIKLDERFLSVSPDRITVSTDNGTVRFGLSAIDSLNILYKVSQAKRTFDPVLSETIFADRHLQWGFYQWYDLKVPESTNLRKMISDYAIMKEIAVSWPVFRFVSASINENKGPGQGKPSMNQPVMLPTDTMFQFQWHYHNTGQFGGTPDADIDLPEAWDITTGDTNVVVAVLDQGVEYTHPDLAGNMWYGRGYNFVGSSAVIEPGDHGSHVAGTISAQTNNITGVSGIAGGNGGGNGVRIMTCQVLDTQNMGTNPAAFANAPVWAADHGASISQNSWYWPQPNIYDPAVLTAIDYFNAHGGGTEMTGGVSIFCAGNNGKSGLYYPGCYSGVIGVAATNNQDKKAFYSNYDSWVDISAPGGDMVGTNSTAVLSTKTQNGYEHMMGTSMACPHVSGVAALVLSLLPGQITPSELRDILLFSTDNIDSLNVAYPGGMGSGRLNAHKALLLAPSYVDPAIPKPPLTFTASTVSTSEISVNWTLNAIGDTTLVVYNTINVFGIPSGNYQAGQPLAGGGTVLYAGTGTSFSHTGLTPGQRYYYAIWSWNGTSYSVVSRTADATTQCVAYGFPLNEPFNSIFDPVCWTKQHFGTGALTGWFGSPTTEAGGTACEMKVTSQSVNPGTLRYVTPAMNTTGLNQINLSFRHMLDAKGTGAVLRVQSSTDRTTWRDEMFSVQTSASNIPATLVEIPIYTSLNSPETYLAFTISGNLGQFDAWYIDDVVIQSLPGTPPQVSTAPVTSVTMYGAFCGGNVVSAGTSDVVSRGVCWSLSAAPTLLNSHTDEGPGNGSYVSVLTGLTPNATYYVRAYAINNSGVAYGETYQFSTICGPITSFPWSESFENGGAIPFCWTQEVVGSSTITWNFLNGNGSGNPAAAHTGIYNGCLKDNNTADTKTRLISPRLNLLAVANPVLTFWRTQAVFITYQDNLRVFYKTSAGGAWNQLAYYGTNTPSWTMESLALPSPTNDYYIAFEGNAKRGHGVCIDDVGISGVMPSDLSLPDLVIQNSQCFNAIDSIRTAGDETIFHVTESGQATLIAGYKIRLLPGTTVDSGGILIARVNPSGPFCGNLPAVATKEGTDFQATNEIPMSRLTICPNPTPGEAKLFFPESGEQKWRTIDLYNMQGARLSVTPLWYEDYATIDLSGQPAGIYIIIVSTDTTCNASRIVKF